tara:strand:+ start:568 stop:762 length:195 start_codon:yes stop_codon:yes gene_type:complete
MFRAIAEVFGLARDVLKRRALSKFDREWEENKEEIKESLEHRDANRVNALFSKLREQGSSSEKR